MTLTWIIVLSVGDASNLWRGDKPWRWILVESWPKSEFLLPSEQSPSTALYHHSWWADEEFDVVLMIVINARYPSSKEPKQVNCKMCRKYQQFQFEMCRLSTWVAAALDATGDPCIWVDKRPEKLSRLISDSSLLQYCSGPLLISTECPPVLSHREDTTTELNIRISGDTCALGPKLLLLNWCWCLAPPPNSKPPPPMKVFRNSPPFGWRCCICCCFICCCWGKYM